VKITQEIRDETSEQQQPNWEISKDMVVNFMVQKIGPVSTVHLLFEVPEFAKSGISPHAYKRFTKMGRSALCDKKALVNEILSRVDSYLWSRKPTVISPQIRAIFELESGTASSPNNVPNAKPRDQMPFFLDPQAESPLKFDLGPSTSFPQFYEEASGHWGVETDFAGGTCAHCTLPLLENPEGGLGLGSGPTIVVFPKCGHAFHNFCIEGDKACTMCLMNNMTTWISNVARNHGVDK